jgi:sigma-E factor negative regulatory protein RseC
MIEETGTVVEVRDHQIAVVLCKKNSLCDTCTAAQSCRMGEDGTKLVDVQNPLGAQIGDEVIVATHTRRFLQSSFLLYVLPLILLLIGAATGQYLGGVLESGPDPNLMAAFLGFSFMTATFIVVKFMTRTLPIESFMPHIIEILEKK